MKLSVSRTTKRKLKKSAYPAGHRRWQLLGLEILFFFALAVFGFSIVQYLLGWGGETIFEAVPPVLGAGEVEAASLYEAPSHRPIAEPTLSPIFTPSVQYWKDDLLRWAATYDLHPDLIATVMQIESCGSPVASSSVGAMGLFQVMPFHFEADDDPFEPDTNALHGLSYLTEGLEKSGGHAGLALAGYNGGHSVIYRDYENWAYETQRYYRWGSGIYREASAGWESSPTLAAWLAAGGQSLCDKAEAYLGITETVSNDTPTP